MSGDDDGPPEPWPGWQKIQDRWQRVLLDASRPPDRSGDWAWGGDGIGWIRRKERRP